MKIRVTLMTENDKHFDEMLSKEKIESQALFGWQMLLGMLLSQCGVDERAIVERCELIEP